jgi:alanine adding enzyme
MTFDELTAEEFTKFALAQSNVSFAQTAEYVFHASRDGAKTAFLGVRSDDRIVLGGLMTWPYGFSGANFYCGPIGDLDQEKILRVFVQGLKKWSGRHGISHVKLNPIDIIRTRDASGKILNENLAAENNLKNCGFKKTGAKVTPHFVYIKNLAKFDTLETLFKSFSASTKAMINGAEKNCISLKKLTRKQLPRLEKLMEDSAARQDFKARGVYFQESLFDTFAQSPNFEVDFLVAEMDVKKLQKSYEKRMRELKKAIQVAGSEGMQNELNSQLAGLRSRQSLLSDAGADKVDVAAGVFVKSSRETVYLFAGNDPKYLKFNAIYLMIWREMQEAFENKVPLFNFYGIEGKFDGSDGILGYKKGFNGVVQEYLGQWILVTNPLKYNSVRALKKLRRG